MSLANFRAPHGLRLMLDGLDARARLDRAADGRCGRCGKTLDAGAAVARTRSGGLARCSPGHAAARCCDCARRDALDDAETAP